MEAESRQPHLSVLILWAMLGLLGWGVIGVVIWALARLIAAMATSSWS